MNPPERPHANIAMPRENLLTLLTEFAHYADDIAVTQTRGYRHKSWTYGKLLRQSIQFAIALKQRNIHSNDRVLLWAPNSAEWLAAFWGCLLRGAVVVPMDDIATPEFANRVAAQAGVKLIVKPANHPVLDANIPIVDVSDLSDTATFDRNALPPLDSLAEEPITRAHLAQILFTSGTTAEPRGVLLTHGNFLANLEPLEKGIAPYRKYERWFHPLRFVSGVPLSHVFGQFMTILVPPLLGATVIFESSHDPREILHTLRRERATALVAVPRVLDLLRSSLLQNAGPAFATKFAAAAGQKFLRCAWRFRRIHTQLGWKFWAFICGGAALSSDTEDFFKRMGYAVVQGYGMTETASLISLNHPFRATQGSIGKILPGRQFRLADDGEILIRGENVSSGYWQGSERRLASAGTSSSTSDGNTAVTSSDAEDVLSGGWLRTGDLGELDSAGNLRFRGRKKNVIVTATGLNIYPDDLEAALRKQPAIRDCVVIPFTRQTTPADQANAEPCAALIVNPTESDPTASASGAVAAANASLADFQHIRTWFLWPEPDFPRTATGKPRLSQIAAIAAQLLSEPVQSQAVLSQPVLNQPGEAGKAGCHAASSASASPSSALAQLLLRFSATPNANVEQNLNLSSLDRVELLSSIESQFHVELDESAFSQAKTVGDLQRLVAQPSAHRTEYAYPDWSQHVAMRALRLAVYYALVWPVTQILAHPKIVGRENLKNLEAPALIVSNHITRRADLGLILLALPPRFRHRLATAMGGEALQEMRRPPKNWVLAKRALYAINYWLVTALFNVFPLPRFSGFRESFRFAGESVDRGYSLLIFPEGVVNETPDGRMAPFQPGIGLLAENLALPIIPMRLDGVAQMKQARRRLARFGELTVHIGAPIRFPPGTRPEEIAQHLQSVVAGLS